MSGQFKPKNKEMSCVFSGININFNKENEMSEFKEIKSKNVILKEAMKPVRAGGGGLPEMELGAKPGLNCVAWCCKAGNQAVGGHSSAYSSN